MDSLQEFMIEETGFKRAISIIESLLQQEQRILNGLREVYGVHSREVSMQLMTVETLEEALRKLREDL